MITAKDIYDILKIFAPLNLKMDFDNPGFLVGRTNKYVSKVIIALDITADVIEEAKEKNADMIISHHPLFFNIKNITNETSIGRKILRLISADISVVCMHTNLDAAKGGVNDVLAKTVGLTEIQPLCEPGSDKAMAMMRCGYLSKSVSVDEFLKHLKNVLKTNGLRYVDSGNPVYKVAVLGGSGSSELNLAIGAGCDTFITADVKYNGFLDAAEAGITLIDGGHFNTENLVCAEIMKLLRENFPDVIFNISQRHSQIEKYYV